MGKEQFAEAKGFNKGKVLLGSPLDMNPVRIRKKDDTLAILPEDGWIVIRPKMESETEAEKKRVDRSIQWIGYDAEKQASLASLTSTGNGVYDRRFSIGDDQNPHPATFLEGVYGQPMENAKEVGITQPSRPEDLACMPNFGIDVNIGNNWFNPEKAQKNGQLLEYRVEQRLDTGTVYHHAYYQEGEGGDAKRTKFIWEIRASRAQRVSLDSLTVIPENWSGDIKIRTKIGKPSANDGETLTHITRSDQFGDTGIYSSGKVQGKNTVIAVASNAELSQDGSRLPLTSVDRKIEKNEDGIYQEFTVQGQQGKKYRVDNKTLLHHSLEKQIPKQIGEKGLVKKTIKDASLIGKASDIIRRHEAVWEKYWKECRVVIEGNPLLQKLVDYNMYQVVQRSREDPHSRRPKEGQVPSGPGYRGHIFLNDVNFIIDQFIYTQPEVAKAMLIYTRQRQKEFIEKAQESIMAVEKRFFSTLTQMNKALIENNVAVQFLDYFDRKKQLSGTSPYWEMASIGSGKATPNYVANVQDPRRIEKLDLEEKKFHLTNDVPASVIRYFRATGDKEFMDEHGNEMIILGALFTTNSVVFNEALGKYELPNKIGVD